MLRTEQQFNIIHKKCTITKKNLSFLGHPQYYPADSHHIEPRLLTFITREPKFNERQTPHGRVKINANERAGYRHLCHRDVTKINPGPGQFNLFIFLRRHISPDWRCPFFFSVSPTRAPPNWSDIYIWKCYDHFGANPTGTDLSASMNWNRFQGWCLSK